MTRQPNVMALWPLNKQTLNIVPEQFNRKQLEK